MLEVSIIPPGKALSKQMYFSARVLGGNGGSDKTLWYRTVHCEDVIHATYKFLGEWEVAYASQMRMNLLRNQQGFYGSFPMQILALLTICRLWRSIFICESVHKSNSLAGK